MTWPFLVAATRRFDYRTVAAPSFLATTEGARALASVVGGHEPTPRREVQIDFGGKRLFIAYRIRPAVAEELSITGESGTLRDRQGRTLLLVEGVVGRTPEETEAIDWTAVGLAIEPVYRDYWREQVGWMVRPTAPLDDDAAAASAAPPPAPAVASDRSAAPPAVVAPSATAVEIAPAQAPHVEQGRDRPPGNRRLVAITAGSVAVIAAALGCVLLADSLRSVPPDDLLDKRRLLLIQMQSVVSLLAVAALLAALSWFVVNMHDQK